MKAKSSRFDRLVACYYPSVYTFAARLTDDPREAVPLRREAFNRVCKRAHPVSRKNFKCFEMFALKVLKRG